MPVPPIDGIRRVILPYQSHPRCRDDEKQSPYRCDMYELVKALGGTKERALILQGLVAVRAHMMKSGFVGFQWIGGSFVEDVEYSSKRSPSDIDVVSFLATHNAADVSKAAMASRPDIFLRKAAKNKYMVDHVVILHDSQWQHQLDTAAFWNSLFSHTKQDDTWKGILLVSLNSSARDADAAKLLGVSP